ncbi:MAG: DUF2231 domain-containing protein [Bacteroidota bacterium]
MTAPFHPVVIHFPLALLSTVALLEVLAVILKRDDLSRAGWWVQLAGTIGILLAVLTGIVAENATMIPAPAAGAVDIHEQLAFVCSSAFAGLLLWRVAARTKIPGASPWGYLALYCVSVVLLFVVGWYGGELVFHYGVGVLPK